MKATDFLGLEIELMQRVAMGPLNALGQVEEAQKMMALTSGYSAAQDFLKLNGRWKNEVEHMAQAHLSSDHLSSYKTAMEGLSLSSTNSAMEAAKRLNENAGLVSALDFYNASLENVASKIVKDSAASRCHLNEQLGFSTAQTLASALAIERDIASFKGQTLASASVIERDIASLKGYTASSISKALERDAMASSTGLQISFALARDAGAAGIEKALANSIGSIASQYAGHMNVEDRLREMVAGMSTFDLATTASIARFHGIDGLARQMAALGLEPSEYLNDEDDRERSDKVISQPFDLRYSALSATSLEVFQQLLINLIVGYILALWIAPAPPSPDLNSQNKKIAKIELLIEKLPQLIESQVEALVRRQLFAVETFFVVNERTARLRTAPEAGSGVLALAFPNQKLKLLDERGKWIRVEFYDYLAQITREGWVLKKYCNRLPSSVNAHEAAVKAGSEFRDAGQGRTVERHLADRQADRERDQ